MGAVLLSLVFVPEFGVVKGLYYGLWHSISAFCNAGFDVIGPNSLIPYQTNILVNLTIAGLIIAGGLGFVVWIDLRMSWRHYKENFKFFKLKTFFSSLSLHTKVVLTATVSLLLGEHLLSCFWNIIILVRLVHYHLVIKYLPVSSSQQRQELQVLLQ